MAITNEDGGVWMKAGNRNFWTPEEEDMLRELYPDHRNSEIAKLMGRSYDSIRKKRDKLGLVKSRKFWSVYGPEWTKEELAYIVEHYADTDCKAIAAHLDRTPNAVIYRARQLGVRKSDEFISAMKSRISREAHASKSEEELAEWYKRNGESHHRQYLSELRRIIFGLPQETNIKVRLKEGKKKDGYMRHLKRTFGYHVFLDTRSCVYYSDGTRRSQKAEEYAKRVYYLRILPLSDRSRD